MSDEVTNEHDVKIGRIVALAIVLVVFILVSGISSCQITKEVYRSDVVDAKTKLTQTRMELETGQNEAILALINDGVNPIAARCAIVGWVRESGTSLCASFVRDSNRLRD